MCEVGQTAHCETTQKAAYGFDTPFGDLNGTHTEALILPHANMHLLNKVFLDISDELNGSSNKPTICILLT